MISGILENAIEVCIPKTHHSSKKKHMVTKLPLLFKKLKC